MRVEPDTDVYLEVLDILSGVDRNTVLLYIEDTLVSPELVPIENGYSVTWQQTIADFNYSQVVNIQVDASDLAGNEMPTDIYSFTIQDTR